MAKSIAGRRSVLAGLGAVATAGALGGRVAAAQTQGGGPFSPTLHPQDAWMASMRGKHRIVLDVTSPDGVPDAIRFAGNLFTGHKNGYDVEESDVAIAICLRHGATAYGYTDALWSKYGNVLDARTTPAPSVNRFATGASGQLPGLAQRGVQFMVCGTASRGISGRIAAAHRLEPEAVYKEMTGNLIPSARIVAAGVVGVVHAQDHGFALIYVG